jgi:hypothetical protein
MRCPVCGLFFMSRFVPYKEQLRDPRWQKRRLQVLQYAGWRCQICGVKDQELHCHHSYYSKGKMAWQYPKGAIISVCWRCHERLHPKKEEPTPTPELPPVGADKAAADFSAIHEMLSKL